MRLRITVNGIEGSEAVAKCIRTAVEEAGYTITREHRGKVGSRVESVILELEGKDEPAPNAA